MACKDSRIVGAVESHNAWKDVGDTGIIEEPNHVVDDVARALCLDKTLDADSYEETTQIRPAT